MVRIYRSTGSLKKRDTVSHYVRKRRGTMERKTPCGKNTLFFFPFFASLGFAGLTQRYLGGKHKRDTTGSWEDERCLLPLDTQESDSRDPTRGHSMGW